MSAIPVHADRLAERVLARLPDAGEFRDLNPLLEAGSGDP